MTNRQDQAASGDGTSGGDTTASRCCFLYGGRHQCADAGDIFRIWYSDDPQDYTDSCRGHLGELVDAHTGADWQSSTVALVQPAPPGPTPTLDATATR